MKSLGLTPEEMKVRRRELQRARKKPKEWRTGHLRRKYNLTQADYDALLLNQNGVCAICQRKPDEIKTQWPTLAVDHDHTTGKVRGLLCNLCNTGLGFFQESPDLINAAGRYLGVEPCPSIPLTS